MEKSNLKLEEPENKVMDKTEKINELQKSKEEKKTNNKDIKNKRKKITIISIIISIIFVFIIVLSTIFALININNNNIISGVKIEGIDVSGLSREEAKSKIETVYNEKIQKDIMLKYEEYDTAINPELLETKYDIENAIEDAISIGKNSNIFVNNYNILFALIGKNNINVNMYINEEITKKAIKDIEANIPGAVIEPDYYIEDNKLIITKGKEGLNIDIDILAEKIKDNLRDINTKQEYIEIPVINKTPEEINIEKIHEEVYKEVQDAYYTKEPFTIHPEVEGIDFNLDEAKKLLEEEKEQYEIILTITKPKITTAQIGSEAFPDLLATYSTNYDASNVSRTTNLRLASQKINEKVILPGETFSYNKTLGERTYAAGYKDAKVYENGQVVDGIGGGICQISSTLYNSVLMSNLEVTERRNHQFVTSYTPAGRDATVVYGLTDFKFKNTRKYAVKIKASVSNGIATVSIYGIKEDNEYVVSFSTKTISNIPYTIKYVDDNSLNAGTEKVSQKGANGIITETYIIKSLNGKVVSTKLLSKDTYNAMQRIILRGTKGSHKNDVTNNVNNTKTNNSTKTENNKNTNNNIINNSIENPKIEKNIIENKTKENKENIKNNQVVSEKNNEI